MNTELICWTIMVLAVTIYKIIARYFEYKEKINENLKESKK